MAAADMRGTGRHRLDVGAFLRSLLRHHVLHGRGDLPRLAPGLLDVGDGAELARGLAGLAAELRQQRGGLARLLAEVRQLLFCSGLEVCELRLRLTGPGLQIPDLGAHLTQLWGRARTLLRARGQDALQLAAVAGACEGSHGLCAQHIDVFVLVLVLLLALALWSLLLRADALEDIEEFAVGALAGQCRPTLITQGLHLVVRFLLQVCSARGENLVEATVGKTLRQRLPGPVSELLVDLCLLRVLVGRT
mmetsp:Transcript_10299/g.36102  ORF Transcript_10299/g.36102 Transcript_10299/m.36102 type:complete len:249 (+) Transcript_10299:450-1196(+)